MSQQVLVVEDNRALAENLAELLRDEGYAAQLASSTSEALDAAAALGFDVALVDVGLSHDNRGLDMLPRLRRHSRHGEIIVMTGNASLRTALQALEQGVYGYVPKPFASPELLDLVKRALAQSSLKREKDALAARLAASEALYRGVVETVEGAIVGLDQSGVVQLANRFAQQALGAAPGGLAGHAFASLWSRPARAARAIAQAAAGATVTDVEGQHGEPARTIRWTFLPLVPPRASAASLAAPSVLAIGVDITERIALEKRQAEAEALAATGSLATSLAHEIRNPLNAASLQLELLQRRSRRVSDPELAAQLHAPVEVLRTELARLSSLLEDFLQLARPRLPTPTMRPLAPLVAEVLALEAPVAASAGVQLTSRVPAELTARIDGDKLKQALLNLVRNAIEALAPRGGEVVISAERAPEGVHVRVSDDGPGMPEALRETALQPFVTTKQGGTGLGLAIVQKLIAQHGGTLSLAPRAEGGTVVSMFFPD